MAHDHTPYSHYCPTFGYYTQRNLFKSYQIKPKSDFINHFPIYNQSEIGKYNLISV